MNLKVRATEPAGQALLDKLTARGYEIDQSEEIQEYLDNRKANAATFSQKDLLLRSDVRKIEVIEEYLHNVQRRVGLTDRLSPWELEVHVKEFMVRHRALLVIADADVEWLNRWLAAAHIHEG